jgi:hypothetical protein
MQTQRSGYLTFHFGQLFNLKNDNIDKGNLLTYPLNCRSFTYPEFRLGTAQVSFLNYGFDISSRTNITDKKITCTFVLSENWLQYLMLLKWFELLDFTRYTKSRGDTVQIDLGDGIKQTINSAEYEAYLGNSGRNPFYSTQGPIVNTNLYLMDNFMNRIATFNFEGCFLTNIKNIDLDYTKTDKTEIIASFTMSFYKYNVFVNNKDLKGFIPENSLYLDDHDKKLQEMISAKL